MGSSLSSGVSLTGGLSFPEDISKSWSFWGRGHPEGGGHCNPPAAWLGSESSRTEFMLLWGLEPAFLFIKEYHCHTKTLVTRDVRNAYGAGFAIFQGSSRICGIEPGSLALEADALTAEPPGKLCLFVRSPLLKLHACVCIHTQTLIHYG